MPLAFPLLRPSRQWLYRSTVPISHSGFAAVSLPVLMLANYFATMPHQRSSSGLVSSSHNVQECVVDSVRLGNLFLFHRMHWFFVSGSIFRCQEKDHRLSLTNSTPKMKAVFTRVEQQTVSGGKNGTCRFRDLLVNKSLQQASDNTELRQGYGCFC